MSVAITTYFRVDPMGLQAQNMRLGTVEPVDSNMPDGQEPGLLM